LTGSDRTRARQSIARALARAPRVSLSVDARPSTTDAIAVDYDAPNAAEGAVVDIAVIEHATSTDVRAGENAGRTRFRRPCRAKPSAATARGARSQSGSPPAARLLHYRGSPPPRLAPAPTWSESSSGLRASNGAHGPPAPTAEAKVGLHNAPSRISCALAATFRVDARRGQRPGGVGDRDDCHDHSRRERTCANRASKEVPRHW
jgi:hypothetical protein